MEGQRGQNKRRVRDHQDHVLISASERGTKRTVKVRVHLPIEAELGQIVLERAPTKRSWQTTNVATLFILTGKDPMAGRSNGQAQKQKPIDC